MTDALAPASPATHRCTVPPDRSVRFVAHLERLLAREALRDRNTGLTPEEAEAVWAEHARSASARRRRVSSPHNPLLAG
jgi:hypothetical protein